MNRQASNELSKLDISIKTDHFRVDVLWFRAMEKKDAWEIKKHSHHGFEFHFCSSGSSEVEIEGEVLEVNEGEFYITAPGVFHEQKNSNSKNYVEYSLNCNITLLDSNESEGRSIYYVLRESEPKIYSCKTILKLFDECFFEVVEKKIGYYNKIKSLLTLIIIESTREIGIDINKYDVPKKYKDFDNRYNQIYNYIKANIDRSITLKEIADFIHLSEKQVNRIVLSNASMSTKKLVNDMKITIAKDLLMQTNKSITEISDELGFSSVYYFNVFFKRYEKVSPTEFKRMS